MQEYLRKKRATDPLRKYCLFLLSYLLFCFTSMSSKVAGPLSDEGRKQQQREKRRLQEQLRRLTRNEEKQKTLAAQLKKEEDAAISSPVPTTSNQLKCGACGLPGHMRTNRTCPMFIEPTLSSSPTSLSPKVKEEAPPQDNAPGTNLVCFCCGSGLTIIQQAH